MARAASAPAGIPSAPNISVPSIFRCPSTRASLLPTASPASAETSACPPAFACKIACMILRYPVQRHSTPPIASLTSSSEGVCFRSSSAVAAISMPGVQMPHCAAPWRKKESCRRPNSGGRARNPSTVVISQPSAWPVATRHAVTGSPSSSTVQAPQSPASHPTLVPLSPRFSRSTFDSRSTGLTANSTACPFTVKLSRVPVLAFGVSTVAISALPHARIQSPRHQRQRGISAIGGRGPYIIDGRKRRQVFCSHRLPHPGFRRCPGEFLLERRQSLCPRRACAHRDSRLLHHSAIDFDQRCHHHNRNHQVAPRPQL